MREVDSAEFTDWLAFYEYEAELMGVGEKETEEETVARLRGFAAAHNAKLAAKPPRRGVG